MFSLVSLWLGRRSADDGDGRLRAQGVRAKHAAPYDRGKPRRSCAGQLACCMRALARSSGSGQGILPGTVFCTRPSPGCQFPCSQQEPAEVKQRTAFILLRYRG